MHSNPHYPPLRTDAAPAAVSGEGDVRIPSAPQAPTMQMRQAPQYHQPQQQQCGYQQPQPQQPQRMIIQPQQPQVVVMPQYLVPPLDEDCTSLQILSVISCCFPLVGWIAACMINKQNFGPRKRKAYKIMLACSFIATVIIVIAWIAKASTSNYNRKY